MKLCKHSGAKYFIIHHPRYHDKRVLLAAHKVATHNVIHFDEAKSLEGLYYISGKKAKSYKKDSNSKIDCCAVPLSELETFELQEHCMHEI